MKKGFTLIELLAVIVILAIIALIAVPVILGIIEDAKKSSDKRSIEIYIDSLTKQIAIKNLQGEFNPSSCEVEKGVATCGQVSLGNITSNTSIDGTIELIDGKISYYLLTLNGKTYTYGTVNESCFISIRQGEISGYSNDSSKCPKSVAIPNDLKLPISEVVSYKINISKCENFMVTLWGENANPNYCTDTFTDGQDVTQIIIDGLSSNDPEVLGQTMLIGAVSDREYRVVNETKYPVDTIGTYAFLNVGLTSVVIPDSIINFGAAAFAFNNITSVVLPSNITQIPDFMFSVNDIRYIDIPSSVETIGECAFQSNNITSVTIPSNVTTIKYRAFNNNVIETLNLSNAMSLRTIGEEAFSINSIKNLAIPSRVETIGECAFFHNTIETLDLSNATSLTLIEKEAFSANKITSIIIPNSVTEIGVHAFQYNKLTSVEIGSGITSIGEYTFGPNEILIDLDVKKGYGPNELTSVRIHKNKDLSIIGSSAFGWASGKTNDNICWNNEC